MSALYRYQAWRTRAFNPVLVLCALVLALPGINRRACAQSADPFSQAALNAINSDLEQEIGAGSTNLGTSGNPFYYPTNAANMLPYLVGSTGSKGMENLLKISSFQSLFFSGGNYSGTATSRACAALTTGTSQNGVYLTPALWNQALFLPVSGTDDTPVLTGTIFTPPNWILVATDGSNPTVWSSVLITSSSNSNPVVGRYAYAIYHEGGLLDANVAGYPSTSTITQTAYKPSLAYADLTQIGLSSTQVDMLVAWRNYASIQVPGPSFTNPEFTAASAANYFEYVLSNSNGYLTPGAAVYNNQTDQFFTSRQQLINFMEGQLGLTGTSLDILNYLATFTRGLNEPSVAPVSGRPVIQQPLSNGGNTAQGLDNEINPAFPTVLVSGTFLRNDGTVALTGQPLVNKRFALNRLVWLTYLGPSATRASNADVTSSVNPGPTSMDYDLWQLVHVYGISQSYLQQGTAANIRTYFGLTWAPDNYSPPPLGSGQTPAQSFHDGEYKWFYNVHLETGENASGQSGSGVADTGTAGSICRVEDLPNAQTPREPDFSSCSRPPLPPAPRPRELSI